MAQAAQASRLHPAILTAAGLVAACGIYYAVNRRLSDHPVQSPLQRSNAVHRPRVPAQLGGPIWSTDATPEAPLGQLHVTLPGHHIHSINLATISSDLSQEILRIIPDPSADIRLSTEFHAVDAILQACSQARDLPEIRQQIVNLGLDDLLQAVTAEDEDAIRTHSTLVRRILGSVSSQSIVTGVQEFFVPSANSMPLDPPFSNSSFAETEVMDDVDTHDPTASTQGLKGLLYHIAEQDAKRKAYEHRGFQCEECSEWPIRGIRWHCLNCPDFDLCSTCEADADARHPKTHVFAKVKIPLPAVSQSVKDYPCWYPGHPRKVYPSLDQGLSKELSHDFKFEEPRIEALYDQFLSCANVLLPEDECNIGVGIDSHAFRQALSSERWPNRYRVNALYDRMFDFYDTNGDSIIGFTEFVSGQAYLRGPARYNSLNRALRGFDIDRDGYLDRQDFLRLLKAKHEIHQIKIDDMITAEEVEEAQAAMQTIQSTQPISSAFTTQGIPQGVERSPQGKTANDYGDMQPDRPDASVILNDDVSLNLDPNHRRGWPQRGSLSPSQIQLHERLSNFEEIIEASQARTEGSAGAVPAEGATPTSGEQDQMSLHSEEREGPSNERVVTEAVPWLDGSAPGLFRTHGHEDPSRRSSHASMTVDSRQEESTTATANETAESIAPNAMPAEPTSTVGLQEDFLDQGILWSIAEAGFNHILDQLFEKREAEDEEVLATRDERHRWSEEIRAAELSLQARIQELQSGSDTDPLMATAADSLRIDDTPSAGSNAHGEATLRPEIVPTDYESLGQREAGIQESSLEELLSSTGYSMIESEPRDNSGEHQVQETDVGVDQNEEKCPSQERLERLSNLNAMDEQLKRHGGPGRLSFQEITNLIASRRGSNRDELKGLVTGWLEWAAF